MNIPLKPLLLSIVLALLMLASSQGQSGVALNAEQKPSAVNTQSQIVPIKKTVLVLFSYQADLPAAKLAVQGIQAEFSNAPDLSLDLYYEYMDSNRFSSDVDQQQLLRLYIAKYHDKALDLVIISSDTALAFWLQHRAEIAPNVPLVIYNISPDRLAAYQLPPDVTGDTDDVQHAQSVKWILQALPAVNEIVIVHGVGAADQEDIQSIDTLKNNVGRQVQWSDWSNLPLVEIKQRAAALPRTSVILYELMFEDAAGVKYRPIDALRQLVEVSAVPVLSGYDVLIGSGTIGGNMDSMEQRAGAAAGIGLRILRGESASAIPFVTDQDNPFIFDHLALQRWDIPLAALPPGSIVKNRQYSFWESYQPQIIATSAGFAVLLLLLLVSTGLNRQLNKTRLALRKLNTSLEAQVQERTLELSTSNTALRSEITERKQAEEALRRTTELYELLAANFTDGVVMVDQQSRVQYISPAYARLMGYSQEEVLGWGLLQILEVVHPDDRARIAAEIQHGRAAHLPTTRYDYRARCKNGDYLWLEDFLSREFNAEDEIVRVIISSRDITERKQAEAALQQSEERLRMLINSARDVIFAISMDGRITALNPAFEIFTGWTRAEWLERPFDDLVAEDDRGRAHDQFNRILRGETLRALRLRMHTRSGEILVVEMNISPQFKDDQVVGLLGIARDMTHEQRAEDELKANERRFRALVEHGIDQISLLAPDGALLYENSTVARPLGYPSGAFLGRSLFELMHPDDLDRAKQTWGAVIAQPGSSRQAAFRLRHADGSWRWMKGTATNLLDEPSVQGIVVNYRDVTERKQAEALLQEDNQILQMIASGAQLPDVLEAITKSIESLSNGALCSILLLDEDGIHLRHGAAPSLPEDYNRAIDGVAIGENVGSCGTAAYRKEPVLVSDIASDPLWIDYQELALKHGLKACWSTPIKDANDRISGTFAMYYREPRLPEPFDFKLIERATHQAKIVIERKQAQAQQAALEAQLYEAQKMESIGRLAGGVAHDFNNMLGVILGHTELALSETDPTLALRADLEEIQKAAQRSANLTRQLLAFARKQAIAPQILDLNQTVAGMLTMLERMIGENIDLVWLPAADLWPVKIDPIQISQILVNLCVNARDAVSDVGQIMIATSNEIVDAAHSADHPERLSGAYVLLAVHDTGSGMDAQIQAHIFEPFFTTKAIGRGTGLGLAIVYGIVTQNHGFIICTSDPGHGTTFAIYLPQHTAPARRDSDRHATIPHQGGRETILFVDDEPAILKLGTTMLTRLGYHVLAAATPSAAMARAETQQGHIDLLITDVVMPKMNGRDLAAALATRFPHLRCLFMSGYTADIIAHHGVLAEGIAFLQKPFSMKDLADMVRAVLERGQTLG